jgi:hypothetical protein
MNRTDVLEAIRRNEQFLADAEAAGNETQAHNLRLSLDHYRGLLEQANNQPAATRDLTAAKAYRKGWNASARCKVSDLDDAEARFTARWGRRWVDGFTAGWIDYAAGREYGYALDTVEEEA